MSIRTKDVLTERQAAQCFAAPASAPQRQYEALRACFHERLPSAEVTRRFGYAPGSCRVLCHPFRHAAGQRPSLLAVPRPGPNQAHARDLVRERAVALRKQYLSV